METLPYSLDSRVWAGGQKSLAVVSAYSKIAGLTGEPLEAVIETGEAQLIPFRRATLLGVRPLIDAAPEEEVGVKVGYRNRQMDDYAWTSPNVKTDELGRANVRVNARYHRLRVILPAESTGRERRAFNEWQKALGVEVYFSQSGDG